MAIPTRLANDGWWLCTDALASRETTAWAKNRNERALMTHAPAAAFLRPAIFTSTCRRLFVAVAVTAFADWLCYGHRLGLSLALFLTVLAALSLLSNPVRAGRRDVAIGVALLFAGLLPIVESLNLLSAAFGVLATAIVVASLTNPFIGGLSDRFRSVLILLLSGPVRLFGDMRRLFGRSLSLSSFTVWIVPVSLSGLFLLLFASANPLIDRWLAAIELWTPGATLDFRRPLFWLAVAAVSWPFIAIKWKWRAAAASNVAQAPPLPGQAERHPGNIFGAGAILRSLVLFNLLFAVQTVLDVTYLWGGVALPNGMTYASYSHRGAYPLIVTALLAAAFVLAAMRPGGPAERVPIIRTLVFVWVGQNVMLVISSILRLDLYVEIYSLTYWRVAAFIWMVLVALGLVLIVAQIALQHSNRWLILANLTTLTLVAYICMFVNFAAVIANYNVAHSREIAGQGVHLDFWYLVRLGPQALPAIDRFLEYGRRTGDPVPCACGSKLVDMDLERARLVDMQRGELPSWRGWSFRGWRLQRYLDRVSLNLAGTP